MTSACDPRSHDRGRHQMRFPITERGHGEAPIDARGVQRHAQGAAGDMNTVEASHAPRLRKTWIAIRRLSAYIDRALMRLGQWLSRVVLGVAIQRFFKKFAWLRKIAQPIGVEAISDLG